MKRISDKTIRNALSATHTDAHAQSPEAFWSDFRARARLCSQEQPEPHGLSLPAWPVYARVCAALALVAAAVWFAYPAGPKPQGVITSVEVVAPHSAVLIIRDEQTDSTVLWITGMNADV